MADRDVRVRLSAQVAQYVAGMQAAAAATDRVTTAGVNMGKLGGSLQNVGRMATLGLTAPMTAAGAAAVGMSNKFNTSFTRMTTLAGISTSEIGRMRDSVLALSKETGRGPQELADALYAASSSGLDASQSLAAVEIAARGAASGLGSTQDIISLVASATASYGEANMDAAKATDILVGTIREGRADPDELAGSLGRVLPVAANLGVSFEEVGGAVAFMSNVFGDTNRTVTAMSGVLLKLASPTDAAREALNQYGTSMGELHAIIDERGLLGAMQHLQEIGLSDDPLAFRAVFDDIEARQGAQAMIDNLGKLEESIADVSSSAGALDEAWGAAQGEDGFEMAQAWAEIQVALVEFGDAIGPIAADIAGAVAQVASAFASLPEGVQLAIAGVLIAVGPMAMIAGTIMKHAQTIAAARALMMAPGPTIAGGAGVLPWWARGAGVGAAAVGVVAGTGYLLDQVYSPDNWTGGRGQRPDRPAPPRQVGNWATDAQMAQAAAYGIPTYTPGWSTEGQASPFTNQFSMTAPARGDFWAAPSTADRQSASNQLAGVFAAGGGLAGPTGTAVENVAAMRREVEMLKAATAEYALVSASTDWGAASMSAAQTAMAEFSGESFALANIAMASEEAFARLDAAVEKNGVTFDVATEAGRENMVALQGVASTLDTQFVSAYTNANGSLGTFMESATKIGDETLARLQTELGLTDEETAALAETLNLTAADYEARFKLAGDEEAKIRLGLLSGVIGLLQEDVQREVAMKIATGDFQGALDLVQENIAETERNPTVTVTAIDNVSGTVRVIQQNINGLQGRTITITTNHVDTYTTYRQGESYGNRNPRPGHGGAQEYRAWGGLVGANGAIGGEAGPEIVDINGAQVLIDRPTFLPPGAMVTPLVAPYASGMGGGGGRGGSFAGGTNISVVVNAGLGTDGHRVGSLVVDALARHTRFNGPGGIRRVVAV